jgi:hypothetical protein
MLLVHVRWGTVGLILGNLYVPIHGDSCTTDVYDRIVARIEAVSSTYPNDSLLLGGDWNAHLIEPRQYSWVDRAMCKTRDALESGGFGYFPT